MTAALAFDPLRSHDWRIVVASLNENARRQEVNMTVKSILDHKGRAVATITREATLAEAAAILAEKKIGALVVSDNGERIHGILSERDVVHAIAGAGAGALDRPVSSFMTGNVVRCKENNTVNQVMEMMTEGRFRHLPVEVDGKLAGIVSIGDVVRKRIEDVEREAAEMKAYIAS